MRKMSERQAPELEDLLDKYTAEAIQAGEKWADAKSYYESIDDKRKPELARLMSRFEGSQSSKEQHALVTPDWKDFLYLLETARKLFYQSQVDYDMGRLKIDVIRSVMSTRREEMKRLQS